MDVVKIKDPEKPGDYRVINAADYRPDVDALYDPREAPEPSVPRWLTPEEDARFAARVREDEREAGRRLGRARPRKTAPEPAEEG